MTLDIFQNIVALAGTIIGLLCCLFKNTETPKRGYLYLIIFFVTHFFSDYYWAIYSLIMKTEPNVSEIVAYIGWNIGYVFLMLAVWELKQVKKKIYLLMFIPVLFNLPQLILYMQFGGIFNNIWQVGLSTAIMIMCMQEITYYAYNRNSARFPHLSVMILIYCILEYAMWTTSCFDHPTGFKDPYLYFSVLQSVSMVFFSFVTTKDYQMIDYRIVYKSETDLRLQTLLQAVMSYVIFGGSLGGYYVVKNIKKSMSEAEVNEKIHFVILAVTLVLTAFILILMFWTVFRIKLKRKQEVKENNSRFNFFLTIFVTLILMIFSVMYNMNLIYRLGVTGVMEDGETSIGVAATDLDDYLAVAETTLRVVADSVNLMERDGESKELICRYIVDQTKLVSEQFDENFTGIYAYVDGEYIDGLDWKPPEGYDPVKRDWYKTAVAADGKVVIVSPYVDAQTGSVVITVAKSISNSKDKAYPNVVCLDVIVNHIQEVIDDLDITGRGYGMVVNDDGFIVAHRQQEYNGKNIKDIYDEELLNKINNVHEGSFEVMIDGEECTLFVRPVMDQWHSVIVISKSELYEDVNTQSAINIIVSMITFWLISFFYYLGYKNEQAFGRRVEDMNIQMVVALAAAIDAKDTYTNGHSSRVAKYSRMIAGKAGYSDAKQNDIYIMGLLHDVGKIGVPDGVINKPSTLTDSEYDLIKRHPITGYGILERIKDRPKLAEVARWHHERYDGTGYPDGIAGEKIPEEARIVAVADAYDAMTSRRSYRDIMPQEKVTEEIKNGMGTQFDPRFAEVMLQIIEEDKDYTLHE